MEGIYFLQGERLPPFEVCIDYLRHLLLSPVVHRTRQVGFLDGQQRSQRVGLIKAHKTVASLTECLPQVACTEEFETTSTTVLTVPAKYGFSLHGEFCDLVVAGVTFRRILFIPAVLTSIPLTRFRSCNKMAVMLPMIATDMKNPKCIL